jgi:hypothetical protein
MRRARVARLRLELNLGFIDRAGRRHNTSGGSKSGGKNQNWMAFE